MTRLIYYFLSLVIFMFSLSFILTGNLIELPHEIILMNQRKFISPIDKILIRKTEIDLPIVESNQKISKNIFQTHKDKTNMQEEYIQNLKKMNQGWKYQFYDDSDCIDFLYKHYGIFFVEKFKSFKNGAHKSDLWRLCVLYKYGGCYLDADILLYESLNSIKSNDNLIIPITDNYLIPTTYNAFIISNTGNEIIGDCIKNIMKVEQKDLDNDYCLILRVMHSVLEKYKYKYFLKEKLFSKLSVSSKNYYLVDSTGKKIGKSKREDYIK